MSLPVAKVLTADGDIYQYDYSFSKDEIINIELNQIIGGYLTKSNSITIISNGDIKIMAGNNQVKIPHGFEYDIKFLASAGQISIVGAGGSNITVKIYTGNERSIKQYYNDVEQLLNIDPQITLNYVAQIVGNNYAAGSSSIFPIGQSILTPVKIRGKNISRSGASFLFGGQLTAGMLWGMSSAACNVNPNKMTNAIFLNPPKIKAFTQLTQPAVGHYDYSSFYTDDIDSIRRIVPCGEIWVKFSNQADGLYTFSAAIW